MIKSIWVVEENAHCPFHKKRHEQTKWPDLQKAFAYFKLGKSYSIGSEYRPYKLRLYHVFEYMNEEAEQQAKIREERRILREARKRGIDPKDVPLVEEEEYLDAVFKSLVVDDDDSPSFDFGL